MDNQLLHRVLSRTTVLYAITLLIGLIFISRLFYLQIVQHDFYKAEAQSEQESKFTLPAVRGQIYAMDGNIKTPLVLNENQPTLFADPTGVEDANYTAVELAKIIDKKVEEIIPLLQAEDTRYSVIAKQLTHEQVKKVEEAGLNGLGLSDKLYRVYPQNGLGSQLLGFVNGEGQGQYGIEQSLNDDLKGEDGRLSAVTDVYGIPLSSKEDNVVKQPTNGQDVTLTIDINIQKYVESALKKGVKDSGGKSGSAIVIDPNTGAIKAMANYPTYDVTKYGDVKDYNRYQNAVVSNSYETGSGMKIFTMSAGLNEGVVTPNTKHQDKGYTEVDGIKIENAEGAWGTITMAQVIQKSVNSGVVDVLRQLGGGEINEQARLKLNRYFTEEFGFGSATGIAQPGESSGVISGINTGAGDNVRYANMTFGQGMQVTLLQMVAALSSVVNGGDYYQPHIIDTKVIEGKTVQNEAQVIRSETVSQKVSTDIKKMMKKVVELGGGRTAQRDGYYIGGKTGTAQVIEDNGEYSEFREVGSFMGFGGRTIDTPQYVVMTRVDEPTIYGYAGSVAAAPIFADISNYLIEYYQIPPNN